MPAGCCAIHELTINLTNDLGSAQAPEVIRGDTHARRPPADVYSYGVLLFELLAGMRPWNKAKSIAEASCFCLAGIRLSKAKYTMLEHASAKLCIVMNSRVLSLARSLPQLGSVAGSSNCRSPRLFKSAMPIARTTIWR